jgi:diadenosine tetraphosphate (Ap4A) HIT family hydrolase
MTTRFRLDPRLKADTLLIGELPLSCALLMNDARFPWVILVPRRAGTIEFLQLDARDCEALTTELRRVALALLELYRPDKLNVAALGNAVPQFHVHVIGRKYTDVAWPKPVFGVPGPAPPYEPAAAIQTVRDFQAALRL